MKVGDSEMEGLQKSIGGIRDCFAEIDLSSRKRNRVLPICAWCKKIRDDQGYWKKVEAHTGEDADMKLTHGICPDCAGKIIEEIG